MEWTDAAAMARPGRHPPPGIPSPAEAKAFTAEKSTALVRLAVILFGVLVYWSLWYPRGLPWLAATVSVIALAYGAFDALAEPYRRFPILLTSAWTTVTDGILITVWLHATGDAASPFFPLWYLSLVAVAFRYDWWATVLAAILYVGVYAGLVTATGGWATHGTEMLLRCGYLLLLGALGALLARASAKVHAERHALTQKVLEGEARERTLHAEMEVKRLSEVNAFKTDFINTAAHELNTPLTPLLLQAHLLRKGTSKDDGDRLRAMDVLERNLTRMAHLVQDMLDVARLQSGGLRLERALADLAPLLAESAHTFEDAARARGIRLVLQVQGPLQAHADRRRIGQVVDNLVSNAIKFTPDGGQVTLRGTLLDDHLMLAVEDTGIGLSQDQTAQLFQPFVRLHRDRPSPGTGLGLYICRGIVERHGGSIGAQSRGPGQGTTFTVKLPLSAAEPALQPTAPWPTPPQP